MKGLFRNCLYICFRTLSLVLVKNKHSPWCYVFKILKLHAMKNTTSQHYYINIINYSGTSFIIIFQDN